MIRGCALHHSSVQFQQRTKSGLSQGLWYDATAPPTWCFRLYSCVAPKVHTACAPQDRVLGSR